MTATLIPSREGENIDATIDGNTINIEPRLFTSAGKSNLWWSFNGGFTVDPGTYTITCPHARHHGGIKRGFLAYSTDGLSVSDPAKVWDYTSGTNVGDARWWTVEATTDALDIANTLPATWSYLDSKLFNEWVLSPYISLPRGADENYSIAETSAHIDQLGRTVPLQYQRMFVLGNTLNPSYRMVLIGGNHAPETGRRAFANFVDEILSGDPNYTPLLEDIEIVCSAWSNPGAYAGHNRGLAVDGFHNVDPNLHWPPNYASTESYYITNLYNALVEHWGPDFKVNIALDLHSQRTGSKMMYLSETTDMLPVWAACNYYSPWRTDIEDFPGKPTLRR